MNIVRLGDIFQIIRNGASIKQKEGAKGFPITRIETISNKEVDRKKLGYADINDIEKYIDYILENDDILMSHINSEKHLGKVAIYKKCENEIIIHGMNLLMLRANKNIVLPKYAIYYFETFSFLNQISKITKKSVNQASFTVTNLKDIKINLPPLEEQKRIANILDKVTELIQKRKQQLDKLDLLVKAKFVEMFGDPFNNKDKKIKLSQCCEINPKKSENIKLNSGLKVSFIPMTCISENGQINCYEVKDYDEVKKGFTYFCENDVIFAKITPCMENGKGAIAKGLYNKIGFGSTEFHIIRPIKNKSNSYWIYTLTTFKEFRLDAKIKMTGSAGQRRVPSSYLENFEVYLPPIELQEQFAKFVEEIEKSKIKVNESLQKLETLKRALMQEYFN